MRSTILRSLSEVAAEGVDLYLLTADLGFRILEPFREAFPNRFFNVGVAEGNMVGVAAGMALAGLRPVCYSMVPFVFMRSFEQFRVDVVAQRLPVVLVGVGGGLAYSAEGMSHHAIEDIAIARALPGLTVIAPGDPHEATLAMRHALHAKGPTYLRVGGNNDPAVHATPPTRIDLAMRVFGRESRVILIATGHILATARQAAQQLSDAGIEVELVSMPLLKPFDDASVRRMAARADAIITVEEHSVVGGLGSMVAEILLEQRFGGKFAKIGLPDAYCEIYGTLGWLRSQFGIDAPGIVSKVRETLGR